MLRRLAMLFALVMIAAMTLAPATTAKAPVRGDMQLDFCGPGNPLWTGTVTIDGTSYGMEFDNTGTGKSFDNKAGSQSHFFAEDWYVYAPDTTNVVLKGYDRGVVSWANGKYRMSGRVVEANDPFGEELVGRSVHMRGVIIFVGDAPSEAPGTFRIN